MKPFRYVKVGSVSEAVAEQGRNSAAAFIAGGTDLLNLMKDGVTAPDLLIDLNAVDLARIEATPERVRIGALARMSDTAEDGTIAQRLPLVREALLASASGQVRSMASIGGNLLQRTRCWYFRDAASPCNTRTPGSGCPAVTGQNRWHAVFGGSDACVRVHSSDLAVALTALGATVRVTGPAGDRDIAIEQFYRLPETTPHMETALQTGELITRVDVPAPAEPTRSRYLKIRDRASFEFALVSLAAIVRMSGDQIGEARLVFGGVAPVPWRSRTAEQALIGRQPDAATLAAAADEAVRDGKPLVHNGFKLDLMRRAMTQVLTDLVGRR